MITPNCSTAYKLLCQGENALSQVSVNGFKIDRDYYMKQKPLIEDEVRRLKKQVIEESEIGRAWQRRFQSRMNLDSADQLKTVLKKDMQFDKFKTTEKGGESADKSVVEKLPYEFSNPFLRYKQLNKAWGSLITPIMLGADENDFVHPNINLHTVRTYRSSCDSPNLQNVPKHNELIKTMVRGGFIPRASNRYIAELDFSAAECGVGLALHKDPQMQIFYSDPDADMHGTIARKFFFLDDKTFCKPLRQCAKKITFGQNYGSGAESLAKTMWEFIEESHTKTGDGTDIKDHMANNGVHDYESCLRHSEDVVNWYWKDLYTEYGKWVDEQWNNYKRDGYIDLPTGFRATALMRRTQCVNIAIQGSTCHVMLSGLIGLQKRLVKYKCGTKLVCQVHDSVVLDVVPKEWDDVCEMYLEAQDDTMEMWKWLTYRLQIDADTAPCGESWAKTKEWGTLHRK